MKAHVKYPAIRHLNRIKKSLLPLIFCIASFTGTTVWAQTEEEADEQGYEEYNERTIEDNNRGTIYDEQSRLRHSRKRAEDDYTTSPGNLNLGFPDLFSNEKPGYEYSYPEENQPWHHPDQKTGEVGENDPIYHDPPPPPDPPDLPLSTVLSNLILIIVLSITGVIALRYNSPKK